MDARGRCLLFATLVLIACGSDHLATTPEGFALAPATLEFPKTYLGHPTSGSISLHNEELARRTATLHVAAPFAVARDSVDLAGGDIEEVDVTFAPEKIGEFSATIAVGFDGSTSTVKLHAEAFEPPTCPAPRPCESVTFDASTGQCVSAVVSDQTSCSAPCLDDGRCVGGVCRGVPKSCDDGNVCTRDSCDPTTGCVHDSIACAPTTDLCHVGVCDPSSGCTTVPASNGTLCGSASCAGASVCWSGRCVRVDVPDGYPCGATSPCQGAGQCHQKVCEEPAPQPLSPEWRVPISADQLDFTGTADSDGNVYWGERVGDQMTIVSRTPAGLERWRTPLPEMANQFNTTDSGKLAIVGDLVVSTLTFDSIVALRRADGSVAWSASLKDFYASADPAEATTLVDLGPLVATDSGLLVRAERSSLSTDLMRVNPTDGTLSEAERGHTDWRPVLGGANPFVMWADHSGQIELDQLDSSGAVLWSADTDFLPFARMGNRLFGYSGFALGSFDLASATSSPVDLSAGIPPVVSPTLAVFTGSECSGDCSTSGLSYGLSMVAVDPSTGRQRWSSALGSYAWDGTWPLLLAGDEVLLRMDQNNAPELRLIGPDGSERFGCPLSDSNSLQAPAILTHGHWIVATPNEVRGYALPGLELGAHGYVTAYGSLARDGRPR